MSVIAFASAELCRIFDFAVIYCAPDTGQQMVLQE